MMAPVFSLDGESSQSIEGLQKFIVDRLPVEALQWKEILTEFEDEYSYLSISLSRHPGEIEPSVLIEFGAQDTLERHASGFFVAQWLENSRRLGRIEQVALNGKACELAEFMTSLSRYSELPAVRSDVIELSIEA